MIIGNAMVSSGLTVSRLKDEVKNRRHEIETYLALGANSRQASQKILKIAIKTGMMPTIDSMKTLGIVQLSGMMTGLYLTFNMFIGIKIKLSYIRMVLFFLNVKKYLQSIHKFLKNVIYNIIMKRKNCKEVGVNGVQQWF
ncbi:uncharacterized protein (TIGR00245 family) [Thermoanaerobacterium thermosulfurigenes]